MDFYLTKLSPNWQSCVRYVNADNPLTGERHTTIGNAYFMKGKALVAIDTYGMAYAGRGTFDIYVDHERHIEPCAYEEPKR